MLLDPKTPEPEPDYVRVTFTAGAHGSLQGSKVVDVLEGTPFKKVPLPVPQPVAQYQFERWDPGLLAEQTPVQQNINFAAIFVRKQEVIENPGTEQPPVDYVRISFVPGQNGSLSGVTEYDVLSGTLFEKITPPTTKPTAQHRFTGWSPTLPAKETAMESNQIYVAQFVKKPTVIENPSTPKPDPDYVRISFTAGAHGSLRGTTRYDLLKGERFDKLTLPTLVAEAQHRFLHWSPTLPAAGDLMTADAAFVAQFEKKEEVLVDPKTPAPAEDYVRISFTIRGEGSLTGPAVYDVLEGTAFGKITAPTTTPAAKHRFTGWSPALPEASALMSKSQNYEAVFEKKAAVLVNPSTPEAPEEYVRVIFTAGVNGSLDGATRFDVLQGSPFSVITQPITRPDAQHLFDLWSPGLPAPTDLVEKAASYEARFKRKQEVIANPGTTEPAKDYVRVSFTSGANGSLEGTQVFDVLEGTLFEKITLPRRVPVAKYRFAGWSPVLPAKTDAVTVNSSYKATFEMKPTLVPNPGTTEPAEDYVRVSFVADANGSLEGTTVFDVLHGSRFDAVPLPKPVPAARYRTDGWNPGLPAKSSPVLANAKYTVHFKLLPEILPNPVDRTPPQYYKRVTFKQDKIGNLLGDRVFDVLIGTAFGKVPVPTSDNNPRFKFLGWTPSLPDSSQVVLQNMDFQAKFEERPRVIVNPGTPVPADLYHRMTFIAGAGGTLIGAQTIDLLEGSPFSHVPVPSHQPNKFYDANGWSPTLPAAGDSTKGHMEFVAQFRKKQEVIVNPITFEPGTDYVRIEFSSGEGGGLHGALTFDVLEGTPFSRVTVPSHRPNKFYEADGWFPRLPDGATAMMMDEHFVANFSKKQEVIVNPSTPEPAPDYVRIAFTAGPNGGLLGNRVYDVLEGTPFGKITVPTPAPNLVYLFDGWSPTLPSKTDLMVSNQQFVAHYKRKQEVIENPTTSSPEPGYVRITFKAGANGSLSGVRVYDAIGGTPFNRLTVPTHVPNKFYLSNGWSSNLPSGSTAMWNSATYEAQFKRKQEVIPNPGTSSPAQDYVRIVFTAATGGGLNGTLTWDVLEGTPFSRITVPSHRPSQYYTANAWSPGLPGGATAMRSNQRFVAQFKEMPVYIAVPSENYQHPDPHMRAAYYSVSYKVSPQEPHGRIEGHLHYLVRKDHGPGQAPAPTTIPNGDAFFRDIYYKNKVSGSSDRDCFGFVAFGQIKYVLYCEGPGGSREEPLGRYSKLTFVVDQNLGSLSEACRSITGHEHYKLYYLLKGYGGSTYDVGVPRVSVNDRTAYEFKGWSPALPPGNVFISRSQTDQTYTAIIEAKPDVKVDFHDGLSPSGVMFLHGKTSFDVFPGTHWGSSGVVVPRTLPPPPRSDGQVYEAVAWEPDPGAISSDWPITKNMVFKMTWRLVPYFDPMSVPTQEPGLPLDANGQPLATEPMSGETGSFIPLPTGEETQVPLPVETTPDPGDVLPVETIPAPTESLPLPTEPTEESLPEETSPSDEGGLYAPHWRKLWAWLRPRWARLPSLWERSRSLRRKIP